MTEQERNDKLEALAGSSDKAFQLLYMWRRATQAASGNRYRLSRHEHVDPVNLFVEGARSRGFSMDAIKFYVEEFAGETMPAEQEA